jgi:hypothetical protein
MSITIFYLLGANKNKAIYLYVSFILVSYIYHVWTSNTPQKTTGLWKVTDKLYHIMLYRAHLVWPGFKLTTFELVRIVTDCIGSCNSNFYMIATSTALLSFDIHYLWNTEIEWEKIFLKKKYHNITDICFSFCSVPSVNYFLNKILIMGPYNSLKFSYSSDGHNKKKYNIIQYANNK